MSESRLQEVSGAKDHLESNNGVIMTYTAFNVEIILHKSSIKILMDFGCKTIYFFNFLKEIKTASCVFTSFI